MLNIAVCGSHFIECSALTSDQEVQNSNIDFLNADSTYCGHSVVVCRKLCVCVSFIQNIPSSCIPLSSSFTTVYMILYLETTFH